MASRLPDGNEQALQQFISQSPWDWRPVRQRLATQMTAAVDPDAWIVDDTGFPKFGNASVGVARQDSGTLGKVANCQVGVSIHAATDQASCPIDWRLFRPESWDADTARRRAAHLPEVVRHRPNWQLVLDLLDELGGWGLVPPVVVADAGYGTRASWASGWRGAGWPTWSRSRPPPAPIRRRWPSRSPRTPGGGSSSPALPHSAVLAGRAGHGGRPGGGQDRGLARGTRGKLRSRFVALGVGPAGVKLRRAVAGGELPVRWLLAEWPPTSPSRSSTGWPACPRTPRFRSWSGWPSCAGASSTTTASSKTALVLTTSRAPASVVGTTT
jgi:hypothetical protein